MTDHQPVIDRCFDQPGDAEALTALHESLGREIRVYLAARSLGRGSLAHDAYQNAFVKFIEIFRDGGRRGIGAGYLVAVAKNCLLDELVRTRRDTPLSEFTELAVSDSDETESRIALLRALDRLEPRCRYALETYYLGGASAAELASRLRVKEASVYAILSRCRQRLRAILEPLGE